MAFTRTTTINAAPGGDSTKQAVLDLDTDLTGAFSHLNTLDTTKSATTHNHTGMYEPADNTILKDADIGVSVAAQVHNHDSLYSVLAHNHALNNLSEKSYNSLTDKPSIPSISGLLDETAHDALDHTGLPGVPSAYTLPPASTTTLGGVKVDGSSITINGSGVIAASAGGIADGDKGDITVSGSGATWTVDSVNGGPVAGFRNVIINGNFNVNQRVYASGAAVGSGLYGHDRWKIASSGDTYTFSTTNNVTTVTIPAGKVLQQVIEGINLQSGTYTLSWAGTAQGKIGAGSYGASGITGTATGGTNLTIEFGPGTVSKVQFEFGSVATPFEARPYGTELALCQRYLPVIENQHGALVGHCFSTTGAILHATFPVTARVAPTGITYANISSWSIRSSAGGAVQLTNLTFGAASKDHSQLAGTVASGLVAGDGTSSYNNGGAGYLYFTGCEL